MGYDNSLDVMGIHRMGGIGGILATGLFASKAINTAGVEELFFENAAQFAVQTIMVAAVALFSVVGTWIILKVVDAMVELRVSSEDEATGLDLSQHNERVFVNGHDTIDRTMMPAIRATIIGQRSLASQARRHAHEIG